MGTEALAGEGAAQPDVVQLTVPAEHEFIKLVRIAAASIARRNGLSVRGIDETRQAIDLACNEVMIEAEDASIFVEFTANEQRLDIHVELRSAHSENNTVRMPDTELISGLRSLTDDFDVSSDKSAVSFTKGLTASL